MTIIETTHLDNYQKAAVLDLWNKEYPLQLSYHPSQFDTYLNNLSYPMHYLAYDESNRIIGWAFTFDRDTERWFAIIVDGKQQRKGIGKTLIDLLKQNEKVLNGWVTDHDRYVKNDGTPYSSPLGFYLKSNFAVLNEIRLEIEILSAVKIIWKAK